MAWDFDTSHTQFEFSAKHMMFMTVKGQFRTFQGTFELDEQNPAASTANITIDAASLTTHDENRDGHLRSPDFLNVAQFPSITFQSKSIEALGDNKFRVVGDLTITGTTKEVPVEVTLEGRFKDMQGNPRYAFTAKTSINRKDFGLVWNMTLETGGVLVGDTININVETEMKQAS